MKAIYFILHRLSRIEKIYRGGGGGGGGGAGTEAYQEKEGTPQ